MQTTALKPSQFATHIAGVAVVIGGDWASEFPLPSASACLIGIAQVRGEVVPVFDPTLSCSLVAHARRKLPLMIVKTSSGVMGFAVESEPIPIQLGSPAFSSTPQAAFAGALSNPHSGGVISNDLQANGGSKVWWHLNIDYFFNELNNHSSQAVPA
jgi:chemotaxis signal transduction protein